MQARMLLMLVNRLSEVNLAPVSRLGEMLVSRLGEMKLAPVRSTCIDAQSIICILSDQYIDSQYSHWLLLIGCLHDGLGLVRLGIQGGVSGSVCSLYVRCFVHFVHLVMAF